MRSAGYAIHAGVLGRAETRRLADALARAAPTRTRAGARHLMGIAAVARLAHQRTLLELAREWLGGPAIPYRATLFDKTTAANWLVAWHQDTALPIATRRDLPGWGPWSEKAGVVYAHAPAAALENIIALRIHLDDSDVDNGPLRVLPGTHVRGVLSDAAVLGLSQRVPAETCCVAVGGVIAMRPLIVHASSKATSNRPRRVLHIEYAPSLTTADGMALRAA